MKTEAFTTPEAGKIERPYDQSCFNFHPSLDKHPGILYIMGATKMSFNA
jgi:hypothetical protein